MDTALEHLERYGIYLKIDVEYAIAFARRAREQGPRIPPIASHAADLLAPDHPHVGFAQRLEQPHGLKRHGGLRGEHRHHPDAPWREGPLVSLRFQIENADGPLLMNQGQKQLGDMPRRSLR